MRSRFVHHPLPVPGFKGSYLLATGAKQVRRAVVFVHGFLGNSNDTWMSFQDLVDHAQTTNRWWRQADLYFMGYDSFHQSASNSADKVLVLLDQLAAVPDTWFEVHPEYYPELFREVTPFKLRDGPTTYEELVLVGHSLGALVLRLALRKRLLPLKFPGSGTALASPALQGASLRLFAPAILGSRPVGIKSFVLKFGGVAALAQAFLGWSPSYNDMLPISTVLGQAQTDTEALASSNPSVRALHADVLWGENEDVVADNQYGCDTERGRLPGKNHVNLCKPSCAYLAPLKMVEDGKL